jgi:hypothetical protein
VSVPERYVATPELAEIMGVSERTIKRLVAEGMPSKTWGLSRCRRFLPSEAIAWASARDGDKIRLVKRSARRANVAAGSQPSGV